MAMKVRAAVGVGCIGLVGCVVAWGAAVAQDMRQVSEPKIPPVCTRLLARLYAAPDVNGGHVREQDEQKLDSDRIQKAIDACGPGKAVELAPGGPCADGAGACAAGTNAFLSGPLEMREGVTLLVDKGVTLYGSRDPRVYETPGPDEKVEEPLKCGTSMPRPAAFPVQLAATARARRGGCRSLISIDGVKNAGIMGDGTIDGRGYATILGKDYSWWQQARKAQPKDDLYFNPRLITARHADGLVLYRIHLDNSPNFHVGVNQTDGFTAWGVHLDTPVDKKLDARNTDGIDPGMSNNVTVAHSWIDNGDDNIAIKAGVTHMSVIDNHFYDGHGMSIGSETTPGQSYLLVDGLVEDHTSSGIRIKSNVMRGGPVHDLVYENICMRNVPIPMAISPYYTNQTVEPFANPNYKGDKIPDYKAITLKNIFADTAGDVLIAGLDDAHRTQVTLENVVIKGIRPGQVHLFYDDLRLAAPGTNIPLSGHATVQLSGFEGSNAARLSQGLDSCSGKFVPMR
jgi:polygalacturonase